jgi:hypothetical protein
MNVINEMRIKIGTIISNFCYLLIIIRRVYSEQLTKIRVEL